MVDEKQQKTEEEFRAANEVVYKHSLELVRLSQELEKANRAQESLLHFISHEVKGYLTKGQSAFAGIVEGDYGVAPPPILELAHGALAEMRKGSSTVMDILEASNLKRGSVNFVMAPFDLKKTVQDTVDELKPHAVERGLLLSLEFSMEEFVLAWFEAFSLSMASCVVGGGNGCFLFKSMSSGCSVTTPKLF